MAPNVVPGRFKIVSLTEGRPPASINLSKPTFQGVSLNEVIQVWELEAGGNHIFRLSIGNYPFTGILDNRVIASIDAEQNVIWHFTYREAQDAYTIEPVEEQDKGWTVPLDFGENPAIEIKTIISTKSLPPNYLATQLFQFVLHDDS